MPARVMALAGHDSFARWIAGPLWTPEITIESLEMGALSDVGRRATARDIIGDAVLRTWIQDRIGEAMGGFHWHGPIPAVVTVRTWNDSTVSYRLEKGSGFAEYIHGGARSAEGDVLIEAWKPCSARGAG